MLKTILPKNFCREYVALKKSNTQLISFMAVVLGIKPAMDDWISKEKFNEFKAICRKYKLYFKPDVVFTSIYSSLVEKSIGSETLTTTKAIGLPVKAKINGQLHIFIAKTRENLERAFKNGWYPLVIKNRVIQKPFVDYIKFGYDLGYPECCVRFFLRYNNWQYYSHLFEVFKNTKGVPSFLANPLTRIVTVSYISHIPCSFNCGATIKMSRKLRNLIQQREPEFVKQVDELQKIPFLVLYEDMIYGFKGKLVLNRLHYQKVYFFGGNQKMNIYQSKLEEGNNLFVKDRTIFILKGKQVKHQIVFKKTKKKPIIPFLIQFQ
jgi:hypothetical protein